jgi:hypothetical protein
MELFDGNDLEAALDMLKEGLKAKVNEAPQEHLLGTDAAEWARQLAGENRVAAPRLADDSYVVDKGETEVDPRFARGAVVAYGPPTSVPGWAAELHIPFEGDGGLFFLSPNLYGPMKPVAAVIGSEVVKTYTWASSQPLNVDAAAEELKRQIAIYAAPMESAVEAHNAALEHIAREAISARRERVLAAQAHLDSLRIPVRRRADAPTTYQAPGIQRRPKPAAPKIEPGKYSSDPVLVGSFYDHIVRLIRVWGKAIERTPDPYVNFDEETLRAALLPMLNSHYEGGATGETFNAGGKTDILVRVEDRNVFIGECKRWKGPESVQKALDQIFSYATWRDTKLALIFFVDRKDPTAVVDKVRELLGADDLLKGWDESGDERELRCRMQWPGDEAIVATLHVSFVHLPAAE